MAPGAPGGDDADFRHERGIAEVKRRRNLSLPFMGRDCER
jgi:hypothetical protein